MIQIYHTYCKNCETKYHLIEDIKESIDVKIVEFTCGIHMMFYVIV